jgi:dTDP-4-dehydrorhamnose reductase
MNKKKILIIGGSSKIGSNLIKIIKTQFSSNFEIFGTYNSNKILGLEQLDITNHKMIEMVFSKIKPDLIIHTVPIIHLNKHRESESEIWKTNIDAIQKIVDQCKKINSKLIFLSSDYIFSGKNSLIDETESINPLNYNGKIKFESEKIVSTIEEFLIIRTSCVNDINPNYKSFVVQVINTLKKNETFDAAINQFEHPTYSINLSEIIVELILEEVNGIFNVAGSTYISRFDFAKKIAKAFCLNPDLINGIVIKPNFSIEKSLKINLNLNKLKSTITTSPLTINEQLNQMRIDHEFQTHIENVKIIPIEKYNDKRGSLSVLISKNRNDAPNSDNTQEVYLTEMPYSATVRASHKHQYTDEFFIMLNGSAKFVLIDDRKNKSTYKKSFSIFLNEEFRSALFVPSGIFHIFKTIENNSKCLAISNKAFDKNNPDIIPIENEFFGIEFEK